VAPQKSQRPRKSAAKFYADLPKNGRKGAELFWSVISHKILDTLKKKTVKSTESPDFFPITMSSESLLTSIKPAPIEQCVCGRIFSPAAECFRNLAENIWPELATLGPNFFASGRIFWLIWQKSFEMSWQHLL
jgi:hypothetical protein